MNNFYVQQLSFGKSRLLTDNMEKYCKAGQAADDNTANAHRMLGP
jgi:hypothetical protein